MRLRPQRGRSDNQKIAAVTAKLNAARGAAKVSSNNRDRKMGVVGAPSDTESNLPSRVIDAEVVSPENDDLKTAPESTNDPFKFAINAGLKPKQVQAAVALAMGSSRAEVAAQAGVTIQTLDKWKRENFVFRAFLVKLNEDAFETARTEALGILNRHLQGKKPGGLHEQSCKDIFDWVKLALGAGDGARGAGRVSAPSDRPSILHQHIHFENGAQGGQSTASDDSVLLNLQMAAKGLTGEKKRKLAELLRG